MSSASAPGGSARGKEKTAKAHLTHRLAALTAAVRFRAVSRFGEEAIPAESLLRPLGPAGEQAQGARAERARAEGRGSGAGARCGLLEETLLSLWGAPAAPRSPLPGGQEHGGRGWLEGR